MSRFLCAEVRPLLERLVDNDLPAARLADVREHIAGCLDCRRQQEEAVSIPTRLRALRGPEPPGELLAGVITAVATARERDQAGVRMLWKPVVAEVILSAIIGWYVSGFAGLAGIASATFGELAQLFGWSSGSAALPPGPSADLVLVVACISLFAVTTYHLMLIARITGSRAGERRTA